MPPKQVVKEDRMSLTLHTDHKQDACQIFIFAPKLWTRCQSKGRNVSGFTTLWWPIYWRESKRKYLTAWEEEAIVCTLYHTIPKVHILSEKVKFYFLQNLWIKCRLSRIFYVAASVLLFNFWPFCKVGKNCLRTDISWHGTFIFKFQITTEKSSYFPNAHFPVIFTYCVVAMAKMSLEDY